MDWVKYTAIAFWNKAFSLTLILLITWWWSFEFTLQEGKSVKFTRSSFVTIWSCHLLYHSPSVQIIELWIYSWLQLDQIRHLITVQWQSPWRNSNNPIIGHSSDVTLRISLSISMPKIAALNHLSSLFVPSVSVRNSLPRTLRSGYIIFAIALFCRKAKRCSIDRGNRCITKEVQ